MNLHFFGFFNILPCSTLPWVIYKICSFKFKEDLWFTHVVMQDVNRSWNGHTLLTTGLIFLPVLSTSGCYTWTLLSIWALVHPANKTKAETPDKNIQRVWWEYRSSVLLVTFWLQEYKFYPYSRTVVVSSLRSSMCLVVLKHFPALNWI